MPSSPLPRTAVRKTAFALAAFAPLTVFAIYSAQARPATGPSGVRTLAKPDPADVCRQVHQLEVQDQCQFILDSCSEDGGALFYLQLFYCKLAWFKGIGFLSLVAWLGVLFLTISIAASDFFSPNLQLFSELLGMSQSMAGVTFLALGNGSPDLFSTFAAINTNSGSLAVGELFGAACFITAVIAGSIAIVKPFRVPRKAFLRDVGFFMVAAGFTVASLADGKLVLWECIVLIALYAAYVALVVSWSWWVTEDDTPSRLSSLQSGVSIPSFTYGSLDGEPNSSSDAAFQDVEWGLQSDHEAHERTPLVETPGRLTRRSTMASAAPSVASLGGALHLQTEFKSFRRIHDRPSFSHGSDGRRHSEQITGVRHRSSTSGLTALSVPSRSFAGPRTAPPEEHMNAPWSSIGRPSAQSQDDAPSLSALPPPVITPPADTDPMERPSSAVHKTTKTVTFAVDDNFLSARSSDPRKISPAVSPSSQPRSSLADLPKLDTSSPDDGKPLPPYDRSKGSPAHELSSTTVSSEDEETSKTVLSWWPKSWIEPKELAWEFVPTLMDLAEDKLETFWDKLIALVAAPVLLPILLTVPTPYIRLEEEEEEVDKKYCSCAGKLVEDIEDVPENSAGTSPFPEFAPETKHQPWCASQRPLWQQRMYDPDWTRWITIVWSIFAPHLTLIAIWLQADWPVIWLAWGSLASIGVSAFFVVIVLLTTQRESCPAVYRIILVIVGFVNSIAWVSIVASQVVSVLKALAIILNISDGIMGLTVFAMANSIGDLAANTAMARQNLPVMAFAACIGGPMLNIMIGIGLSVLTVLTRNAAHHGGAVPSYDIQVTPSLAVSGITLLVTLAVLLVCVTWNSWSLDRRLGITLISLWTASMVVNVSLELTGVSFGGP